jgi:septum formation protein
VAVAAGRRDGIVIGCDTVVVLDGHQIGKPADETEAAATLRRLRGRPHQVFTGVAVTAVEQDRTRASVVTSTVLMADYDEPTIAAYVATGEPLDKAGSYAAQGRGAALIAAITGCYTNVVGLPLCELAALLRQVGVVPRAAGPVCTDQAGRSCIRLE